MSNLTPDPAIDAEAILAVRAGLRLLGCPHMLSCYSTEECDRRSATVCTGDERCQATTAHFGDCPRARR